MLRTHDAGTLRASDAGTTVIPGARNVRQALANVAAASLPPLTATPLADLERVYDERIRAHVHDGW